MATLEEVYWNSFLPVFFEKMVSTMRKNMTKVVSEYGLSSSHSLYLIALNLQEGQTLVQLSRFLELDPANTNRILKTLKDKGFVWDDRKTENSKKYSVFLTDSGRELAKKITASMTEDNSNYFNGIPREEVVRMRMTLIKVIQNMDPGLKKDIGSDVNDPFYAYLQTVPASIDSVMIPWRLVEDDPHTQKKS